MKNQITCPSCGHQFNVEEALTSKLEASYKQEFEQKMLAHNKMFQQQKDELEKERTRLEKQLEEQDQQLKAKLQNLLETERKKIEERTAESFDEKIKALVNENEKRKHENKLLREKEVDLLRKESELNERQEELSLQIERQLLERQKEIEEKARLKERESFEMEKIKLLKQIDDNKKLAEEMKRKAEQGSMQLQGEVQELALLDLLSKTYPFDEITEVPKGVRGADTIQKIFNAMQQPCGSIVYESKRTKNFASEWIDKLKQDQITCKAEIAVLVTETMPAGMERFGQREGVWICGFHEIKSLSFVLREMLIKLQSVKLNQENRGDKMELLYTYLTSSEFVQTIKRIIENYDAMYTQLQSEKKAMTKVWAIREKQIWAVQENISIFFGAIKGIAGKELNTAEVLQLPDRDMLEEPV